MDYKVELERYYKESLKFVCTKCSSKVGDDCVTLRKGESLYSALHSSHSARLKLVAGYSNYIKGIF